MPVGVSDVVAFTYTRMSAHMKELLDSGVGYGEAMRQVYHPGMSKEDYAAWCAKYTAAYNAQFGVKQGGR